MKNQDHNESKKLSKQEYNKLYYQKHKEKLLKKKKGIMENNILPLFTDETRNFKLNWYRKIFVIILRILELLALVTLTVALTYFQIHEAATFYREANDPSSIAFFKASLVETAVILFSFSRSKVPAIRWGQRVALLVLCSLTLSTMSGNVSKDASQNTTKATVVAQTVRDLEEEKARKEELRQEFMRRGRITLAKQYEKRMEALQGRLDAARHALTVTQAPRVVATSLWILITVRLLAMMINLICVHRLAEIFGLEALRKQHA